MKLIIACLLVLVCCVYGDSRRGPEQMGVTALARKMGLYEHLNAGKQATNWEQMREVSPGLISVNNYFRDGDVWEMYQFIGEPMVVDGRQLCMIRNEPLDWPDFWKSEDSKISTRHKKLRFLVVRDSKRRYFSEWWYEDKVQAVFKEKGVMITSGKNPKKRIAPLSEPLQSASNGTVRKIPAHESSSIKWLLWICASVLLLVAIMLWMR
jgi:hypothetical protein